MRLEDSIWFLKIDIEFVSKITIENWKFQQLAVAKSCRCKHIVFLPVVNIVSIVITLIAW